ncbi:hypothetical protein SDC9_88806 [bioreactor metagenome]|uniref:Uncharacterized protein n=1 Tax=bioreactor metagenome TaxID=1076179 RepID=A0A644ZX41_9ZZZZ
MVDQIHPLCNLARHYPEVRNLAKVLLNCSFINKHRCLARNAAWYNLAICKPLDRFVGSRGYVYNKLHEPLDSDILFCRKAEQRHNIPLSKPDRQTFTDFVLGKHAVLKEGLHQRFIVLGCHLGKLLVILLCLVLEFGRDFHLFACAVLVLEPVHLHFQNIYERVERRAGFGGELNYNHFFPECLLEGFEGVFEVCLFVVQLVYSQNKWFVMLFGIPCKYLCSHLYTLLRVDHHYSGIGYLEGRYHSAHEIIGTGSVDYIQLIVHKLCVQQRRINRALVNLLYFGIVAYAGFGFDRTSPVNNFTFKQHGFRKSSFT